MNAIEHPNIYMRSLATREAGSEVSRALPDVIAACKVAGFDLVIVETSGIGQGDAAIVPLVDVSLYVMTPEFGAASQLEKIDMLDFADFVAINKFDRKGAADALRDVRKQYQRNRELFEVAAGGDAGVRHHGVALQRRRRDRALPGARRAARQQRPQARAGAAARALPRGIRRPGTASSRGARVRYLAEIAEAVREYHRWAGEQSRIARERQQLTAAQGDARRRRRRGRRAARRGGARRPHRRARGEARSARAEAPRHVAADQGGLQRRRVRGEDPRQGDPHRAHLDDAVRHAGAQGRAAALRGRRRDPALAARRERPGQLPVHRRRVRVQARERGPDADVRRRGRPVPHQPALPPARRRHAGQAPVDRVRLGDALRQRPRPAPRHLRQGRQFRRVDRHARRPEGALLGLRPAATRRPACR